MLSSMNNWGNNPLPQHPNFPNLNTETKEKCTAALSPANQPAYPYTSQTHQLSNIFITSRPLPHPSRHPAPPIRLLPRRHRRRIFLFRRILLH